MWTKSEDSCLAWLVCMGAFITLAGVIGIDNSFGIVIDVIITQFDSSTSRVSWIQSTLVSRTEWVQNITRPEQYHGHGGKQDRVWFKVAKNQCYYPFTDQNENSN